MIQRVLDDHKGRTPKQGTKGKCEIGIEPAGLFGRGQMSVPGFVVSLSPGCIPDKISRQGLNDLVSGTELDTLEKENRVTERGIIGIAIYKELRFDLSKCMENRLTTLLRSTTFTPNPVVIRSVATNLQP